MFVLCLCTLIVFYGASVSHKSEGHESHGHKVTSPPGHGEKREDVERKGISVVPSCGNILTVHLVFLLVVSMTLWFVSLPPL